MTTGKQTFSNTTSKNIHIWTKHHTQVLMSLRLRHFSVTDADWVFRLTQRRICLHHKVVSGLPINDLRTCVNINLHALSHLHTSICYEPEAFIKKWVCMCVVYPVSLCGCWTLQRLRTDLLLGGNEPKHVSEIENAAVTKRFSENT